MTDDTFTDQHAVLRDTKSGPIIRHMWEQEKVHLATFKDPIGKHRVRPTAVIPIWNVAGFLLGAGIQPFPYTFNQLCICSINTHINDIM